MGKISVGYIFIIAALVCTLGREAYTLLGRRNLEFFSVKVTKDVYFHCGDCSNPKKFSISFFKKITHLRRLPAFVTNRLTQVSQKSLAESQWIFHYCHQQ